MDATHRSDPLGVNEYDPVCSASGEGQAFANLLSVPDINGFIPQDVPLELEPWAQEVAATIRVNPSVTAEGSGVSLSTGGSDDRRNSSKPRKLTEEQIRRRHADRQNEYRKRRQNEVQVTEKSLQMVEDQLVVAREEQTALRVDASVLQKMVGYTEGVLQAIRDLTGVAQHAMSTHFQPAYEYTTCLFRVVLMKAVIPTDSQLRSIIKSSSLEELKRLTMSNQLRLAEMSKQWEKSPESRSIIEKHLTILQNGRVRGMNIIVEERPDDILHLIQSRAVPLGADGQPNKILRDGVAALQLSTDQMEAIKKHWIIYMRDVIRARSATKAMCKTTSACLLESEGMHDISASIAASLFLGNLVTAERLENYASQEGVPLLNLLLVWVDTLTPLQGARLAAACGEYLPDPLQLCTILFEESKQTLEM